MPLVGGSRHEAAARVGRWAACAAGGLGALSGRLARLVLRRPVPVDGAEGDRAVILDTSVIIDGRILGVCATGFVEGRVIVPGFVLRELEQIEGSAEGLRRNRARRGFAVLDQLRRLPRIAVETDARDFPALRQVDDKVVELARATGGRVLTNDVELARRAARAGVRALSVNELADALRPVALPGEPLTVRVVKEGREPGQGVAYLDDGTMVVVEQGRGLIGRAVEVTVTTTVQTRAGRMIFTRLATGEAGGEAGSPGERMGPPGGGSSPK